MKILIVEDDNSKKDKIDAICIRSGVLQSCIGYATNAHDARNLLRSEAFDLLILDLALPHFRSSPPDANAGLDLVNELNNGSIDYHYPKHIIAITGHESLSDQQQQKFDQWMVRILHYDPIIEKWQNQLSIYINNIIRSQIGDEMKKYNKDICVVTALPSELMAVRSLPWGWSSEIPLDDTTFYWEGNISTTKGSLSAVVAHAPKMGMVPTAALTTKMLMSFKPKVVAMTGICGGISDAVRVGDVVLANPCWDWQSGKLVVKGQDVEFLGDPHQITIEEGIIARYQRMIEDQDVWKRIRSHWLGNSPHSFARGIIGPAASGAAVLADGITIRNIKEKQHRKLTAIDMEIYGLYAASRYMSSPKPIFLALKSVSDLADENKGDDYQDYCSHNSAWALHYLLTKYMEDMVNKM